MRIAVVTHVVPQPFGAGQNRRVEYTLGALRQRFHVTLVTFGPPTLRDELAPWADEVAVLDPVTSSVLGRARGVVGGGVFRTLTGLKRSNYVIGRLEISPKRIASSVDPSSFDCVLFEYFHASDAARVFTAAGVPTVIDLHNVMWRSFERQLDFKRWPRALISREVARYRAREQRAWGEFDALVAVNEEEADAVQQVVGKDTPVWHIPMGIPLDAWPYAWMPANPPRVGFYGGLGTPEREEALFRCYEQIMPAVWAQRPDVELSVIGGRPSTKARDLASDSRIRVTGWLDDVRPEVGALTALLCPWTGRFGFRSRLVEVMAIGTPVVATPDAVSGMGLVDGEGILLESEDAGLARRVVELVDNAAFAQEQSTLARAASERLDFDTTYGELARLLEQLAQTRGRHIR